MSQQYNVWWQSEVSLANSILIRYNIIIVNLCVYENDNGELLGVFAVNLLSL